MSETATSEQAAAEDAPRAEAAPGAQAVSQRRGRCHWCGSADDLAPDGKEHRYFDGGGVPHSVALALSRCAACAQRRERAQALLAAFPAVAHRQGSADVALWRAEAALAVPDALGVALPDIRDARALALLLARLMGPGVTTRYTGYLAPQSRADGQATGPQAAAPERWGHLDPERRAELRTAFTDYLRLRIETPRPVPHPDGGGCAMCGVGSYTTLPSRAASAWTKHDVRAAALGGRSRDGRGEVYVCGVCQQAVSEAGSLGPTAMSRAVFRAVGAGLGAQARVEIKPTGFAALPAGTPANDAPWQHLDLAALRRELAEFDGR